MVSNGISRVSGFHRDANAMVVNKDKLGFVGSKELRPHEGTGTKVPKLEMELVMNQEIGDIYLQLIFQSLFSWP